MKKLLIVLALVTAFAIPSFADFFNINLSGGYTTLTMAKANTFIQSTADSFVLNPSATKLGNGFYGALDLNFAILPVLMFGPRVEYIYAPEAKASGTGSETLPVLGTVSGTITDTFGASLIPIMLGISYKLSLPGLPLSLKAGVYGGYGLAYAYQNINMSVTGVTIPGVDIPFTGSGFVGEALLSVDFSVAPFTSFGLNFGYRTAISLK